MGNRASSVMPYQFTYWFRSRHLRRLRAEPWVTECKKEFWDAELGFTKITKEDLNRLVMNFLIFGGFQDSATKFQMETGTEGLAHRELLILVVRLAVKNAICRGDVEDAVNKIYQLNPQILDESSPLSFQLFFHFQQQKVLELIRNKRIEDAVKLAKRMLLPMVDIDATLLPQLQQTHMLLLREDASNCPMEELLDMSRHLMIASYVDEAILTSLGYGKESQLTSLLKTLIYVQDNLDVFDELPYIQSFKTCEIMYP